MFISLIFFLSSNPAAATTASTHRPAGCNVLRTFATSLVPSIVRGREMGKGGAKGKGAGNNRAWHGQERPRRDRFANGRTARQELSQQDYHILKLSHEKKLDKWSRIDCVSWCGTMLLRHVASCEERRSTLAQDGSMAIVIGTQHICTDTVKVISWIFFRLI